MAGERFQHDVELDRAAGRLDREDDRTEGEGALDRRPLHLAVWKGRQRDVHAGPQVLVQVAAQHFAAGIIGCRSGVLAHVTGLAREEARPL